MGKDENKWKWNVHRQEAEDKRVDQLRPGEQPASCGLMIVNQQAA
jgi:hypothetical protein